LEENEVVGDEDEDKEMREEKKPKKKKAKKDKKSGDDEGEIDTDEIDNLSADDEFEKYDKLLNSKIGSAPAKPKKKKVKKPPVERKKRLTNKDKINDEMDEEDKEFMSM